jgi:hypothetical protein
VSETGGSGCKATPHLDISPRRTPKRGSTIIIYDSHGQPGATEVT